MKTCSVCHLGVKTANDGTAMHSDTGAAAGYVSRPHYARAGQ